MNPFEDILSKIINHPLAMEILIDALISISDSESEIKKALEIAFNEWNK